MKEQMIETIRMIIEQSLNQKIDVTQLDTDLTQLGLDSVAFIKIVVTIEEEFHCEIPDSKLFVSEMNTINKIYDVVCATSFKDDLES